MRGMRVVGKRRFDGSALEDQGRLARTVAVLRGAPGLVPRGLYRFKSFEEADAWMIRALARTHALRSRKTSGSAAR